MPSKNDPKDIVKRLLEESLSVHVEREKSYDTGDNVFQMTADISNIVLNLELTAEHISFIFVAMKLARYSNARLEVLKDEKQTSVIWDTVKDAMVYMALTERERQKDIYTDDLIKKVLNEFIKEEKTSETE